MESRFGQFENAVLKSAGQIRPLYAHDVIVDVVGRVN